MFYFFQKSEVKEKKQENKNTQNFYYLQILLTKASLAKLNLSGHKTNLFLFYQIFIYGAYIFLQLYQLLILLHDKLVTHKELYKQVNVRNLRLQLLELQVKNSEMIEVQSK